MIGLDSSVLIRFLTQDDPDQARSATKVVDAAAAREEPLYVAIPVLCETVWVLHRRYKVTREDVAEILELLLISEVFELEQDTLVRESLKLFRSGRAGFTDYLIGALGRERGCDAVYTFDRGLRLAPGFRVL